VINVWHVLALSVLQGLINAFDMPARQSMVVQMVEDRADLPNAIALNSSMVNAARLLGPAAAGVLIAAVGEGWFFIDAVSYVAVIASLLSMRIAPRPRTARSTRVLHEMHEGFL
jgi:MFS family permease